MSTIADSIGLHASRMPDRLAIADLTHGGRWTYAALDADIARCSAWLMGLPGYQPGARVASLARNRVELVILHAACARTGGIYVPLNWRLSAFELAPIVTDTDPCLIVADPDFNAALPSGWPVMATGALAGSIAAFDKLASWMVDRHQPSLILYTSGTSGQPKGVLLSEANLDETAVNFAVLGQVSESSVFLNESPMFHILGLVTSLRPVFLMGACVLLSDSFVQQRTLARLADSALAITHYFCVPQVASRLRGDPAYDPAPLRGRVTIFTGGAPHARADIQRWLQDGVAIVDGFGMSEAGTVFGMPMDCARIAEKAGAAGVPTPRVAARLVDANGNLCAPGECGELHLRGANITGGYWKNPAASARAFTSDGWFMTGDIAVQDAEGFYTLVDRKKDMFISGGENIYPAEIEAALVGYPGLVETAVVGVPDPQWGEVGHCAVVTVQGAEIDFDQLQAHLTGRLARYKLPRAYFRIDALPRTGSGKVRKTVLRELLGDQVHSYKSHGPR